MFHLYTPYEAMKELHISRATLFRRYRDKTLRTVRISKTGNIKRIIINRQKLTKEQLDTYIPIRDVMDILRLSRIPVIKLVRDGYLKQYPGVSEHHKIYYMREIMEFIESGGRHG